MRFAAAAMPDSGTVETEPASFGVACVDSIISGLEAPRTEKFVPTYTRHLTDAGQRLERMFVLYYDDDTDPYEVVAALSLCSELEAVSVSELAEPSGCGTYRHEPTDTYFVSGAQWNLDNEADDGTDIDAPEAWYIERGNNVVIGIVDGGTMLAIDQWGLHEDIAYFYNSAEDKDPLGVFNAADLDGQDSPLDSDSEADNVIGWNFWDPPRLAEEAAKQEWRVRPLNAVLCDPHYIPNPWRILKCAPHGFSVESIAVAKDDGGESLVGVAPAARVYHARTGSSPRRTADAVYHAAQHARVINMSWVYGIDYQVLRDVVRSATAPESLGGFDCVLVGGAGNAPNAETHLDVQWPALYDSVLAVGSMTQSVDLWNLSAYGPYVGSVSLVAPVGEGIPAHSHDSCPGPPIACPDEAVRPCNSHIVLFKGTSGAAPQVAGVAALIRARFPDLNQFQVKQRILRSAEFYWEDTTENRKKFGAGKLNAYRALTEWGEISGEVTWSPSKTRDGKYYISGDLTIPAGASLTIDPGTIVKVAPDNEAGGTDTDRVEIVVEGELNIGTSGDPVIFESFTDSDPTSADWVGIRIVAGSETSGLDNLIIRNAQVAIENEVALELGDVKLEDCESAVLGADVKVKTDGKLTVAPGMVFWVGPDEDGGGVDPDWVEFVVDGELSISRGTGPTVFKSSAGTPTNKDWLGIWVSEGATATMENVEIRNAYQAIGTRSTLTVRKGHIEDCARIGLSIGGDGQGQADFTVTADTL
ncbi:MAG: S8 family peptidase, partial [Candidatus Krumholzibacteria bacterium]|nr:S8 family peptidase [Candidatus Krumholzibacteria bacterium]